MLINLEPLQTLDVPVMVLFQRSSGGIKRCKVICSVSRKHVSDVHDTQRTFYAL